MWSLMQMIWPAILDYEYSYAVPPNDYESIVSESGHQNTAGVVGRLIYRSDVLVGEPEEANGGIHDYNPLVLPLRPM
jgi:hypothetical protein